MIQERRKDGKDLFSSLDFNAFSKKYDEVERLVALCSYNNEATFKKNVTFQGDSIDIAFLVLREKIDAKLDIKIEKVIIKKEKRTKTERK